MDEPLSKPQAAYNRTQSKNRRRLLQTIGSGVIAASAGCLHGDQESEPTNESDGNSSDADGDSDGGEKTTEDGSDDDTTSDDDSDDGTQDGEPTIDPNWGYPGLAGDGIPDSIEVDHTVDLKADEQQFITDGDQVVGVRFGAWYFDPVGLHIEPGDVVHFRSGGWTHLIASYHSDYNTQQRVPSAAPPFSSPVLDEGGFWVYEFTEPGVYDLVDPGHELYGGAMRIVVGDTTEPVVRSQGDSPELLSGVLLGTGAESGGSRDIGVDSLAPQNIVQQGSISATDVTIDQVVQVPQLVDPSE